MAAAVLDADQAPALSASLSLLRAVVAPPAAVAVGLGRQGFPRQLEVSWPAPR